MMISMPKCGSSNNMELSNAIAIADEIIGLFENYGGEEYAGEAVTQLQHMLQAGELARKAGFDEEVVLAAFLHDIGHICVSADRHAEMDGYGIMDHDLFGHMLMPSVT
jgi:predicted HD phosphohydrolase